MSERFANNAKSTLAAELAKGATKLTVVNATAFPSAGSFRIIVGTELMLVTAVAGTTFTVERAIEGTSEAVHANGAEVEHIVTAAFLSSVVTASSTGGAREWAKATFYAGNDLVTNGGITYICLKAHTSGSTFSGVGTNWAVLAGTALATNQLMMPSLKVPTRPQRTVLQQFQASNGFAKSGTPGTLSEDTSDYVVGTQSLKFVTDGAGGTCVVEKKSISPTIDFTGKDVRVTFKVEGLANVSDFSIYLSSDNAATNNVHYPVAIPSQPYVADGEWATVTISWGDLAANGAVGTINRAAVNYIKLRFVDKNASAVTIHVNEVAAVPEPSSGVCSLVFDDGWESNFTRARPYLDKYGLRATTCIIRDVIGTTDYLSLAQLKVLQNNSGWDVCAHADTVANHNTGFATLGDSVVEGELQGIKRWLIENGFRRRDLFMWPRGEFTASQMVIAQRYFNAIRGTCGGKGGAAGPQEVFPPGSPHRLRAWLVGPEASKAEVESALTECSTYKTWLILSYHRIVASGAASGTEINEARFKEHIDAINASGISVKTVAEVLES